MASAAATLGSPGAARRLFDEAPACGDRIGGSPTVADSLETIELAADATQTSIARPRRGGGSPLRHCRTRPAVADKHTYLTDRRLDSLPP